MNNNKILKICLNKFFIQFNYFQLEFKLMTIAEINKIKFKNTMFIIIHITL